MPEYQVHLHVNGRGSAVATFDSMTEAYLYMMEQVLNVLFFLPQSTDAYWVDDDRVSFKDANGVLVASMQMVMQENNNTIVH